MRIGNVLFVVHHFKPILTGILPSQVTVLGQCKNVYESAHFTYLLCDAVVPHT